MLPELFIQRLSQIFDQAHWPAVESTFFLARPLAVRVNHLKWTVAQAKDFFQSQKVLALETVLANDSFVLQQIEPSEVSRWEPVVQGKLYIQSLSSMLPAIVLSPQPGEDVLDLCAAPGSKTSQMADLMHNQGQILAVDCVRPRFYRLKSVLNLLGVQNVQAKCLDGARLRCGERYFDRILVDAPCSSESRFQSTDPKSFGYWSLRKIKEMAYKQKGLLLNACRLLKPGGVLVYSTCTFAPEENEEAVDWLLKKLPAEISISNIYLPKIQQYPCLSEWQGKTYHPQVSRCIRVQPTSEMEGFFIAKIQRN